MFFVLSKLFAFFLEPLNVIVILFGLGLLAIVRNRRRAGIVLSAVAMALLALSIWMDTGVILLKPLESRFQRPSRLPGEVTGIVLLGGAFAGDINRVRHGYELNGAADRIIETIKLARLYPNAKVLISGGNGSLARDDEPDADSAPALFAAVGIARDRLILEDKSRNTYQNAIFSKQLANPKPGENWILVTSAFHMPRAVGIFRKVGFPVIPWPSDYRTRGNEHFGFSDDTPEGAAGLLSLALHEWIGLSIYWMTGRTSAIFPTPVDVSAAAVHVRGGQGSRVALASAEVGAR